MSFFDKMKDVLDKGVEASKSAFDKAGVAVQDFGDKSVTKIEIKKLESKADRLYEEIGRIISDGMLKSKTYSLPVDDEDFKKLISDVKEVRAEIKEKADSLESDVKTEKK